MTENRLNRLIDLMQQHQFAAVAINPGPTLTYLTGLHFHLMERPTVLIVVPGKKPVLVLPELEIAKVAHAQVPLETFKYGENPLTWPDVFRAAVESLGLTGECVGLEPTRFRFLEHQLLQSGVPTLRFASAEPVFSQLRMQKDAQEVTAMRKAVQIAQTAFLETLKMIHVGVTEREIAAELSIQLLRAGSESEMPFSPIIAGGPNSANPHAAPTDRPLQKGDLLVIDWGAAYEGYVSDLTRTLAIGEVEPEFREIASIVKQANAAGCAAARPGIPAGQVDVVTRAVISRQDYGPYFRHRTGHGLGMEGHEPPYIYGENELLLQPGMAFTVEPGIYLLGRGGVRIEDNLVITETGADILSDLPRDLWVID